MTKTEQLLQCIDRSHYWQKMPEVVETIPFNNRTFFSKYRRIDAPLTDDLIRRHSAREITLAHSLIRPDRTARLFVIDYNGNAPQRFYHLSGVVLSALGVEALYTFHSKSEGHLHLYADCGVHPLQAVIELGKMASNELAARLERQWKVFPTEALPEAYNIINLPYEPFSLATH